MLLRFLAVALAAAALLGGGGHAGAQSPTLFAPVGTNDGFDISLNFPDGQKVRFLPPGTYTIVVQDRSRIHNFHLASNEDPTVDFRTELDFVGEQSFTVTFRNETGYAYACEPHFRTMNGRFLVTSNPPHPPPPPPPPPPPVRKLSATVAAAGAVTLSSRSVRSGTYSLTVHDRSATHNLHLTGPGVNRKTGLVFKGDATWKLKLAAGTYRYGSDRSKIRKTLTVKA